MNAAKKWSAAGLCLAGVFMLAASSWTAASRNSFVYDYEGNTVLVTRGASRPLRPELRVQSGDVLRADANGMAEITFNGIAGVRLLGPLQAEFKDTSASSTHLKVHKGTALLNLRPSPSGGSFVLETPLVLARSSLLTQYVALIDPKDGSTTILLRKGVLFVTFKTSSSTVTLLENQALEITPQSFVSNPREIREDENKLLFKTNGITIAEGL